MTSPAEPQHPVRAVADVDIAGVADALDNASDDFRWWYDPATGRVEPGIDDVDALDDDYDGSKEELVAVESFGSRDAYRDMVDFASAVGDPRASELLMRALDGRGAFRRFRDTIDVHDELLGRWLDYRRVASERRAIDWLAELDLIDPSDAETERNQQTATMSAILAAIANDHEVIDRGDMVRRWDEISDALDAGATITVTRDGREWATITPVNHPDP